jgi:Glutaredoxin 2
MVANYKETATNTIYLLNDDEQSCFDLVGAKMVPILETEEGAMGESLDIASVLDQLGKPENSIRPGGAAAHYLDILGSVNFAINCLLFPRNIHIGLPEFETQSARDYFQRNKEK